MENIESGLSPLQKSIMNQVGEGEMKVDVLLDWLRDQNVERPLLVLRSLTVADDPKLGTYRVRGVLMVRRA